jgi:DtxR family transcriptional regulator, Mn-dependent transcriptional regulator
MRAKESREMYLETIYRLEQESETVRSIDIAKKLGFSKPSVSRAIGVLKKSGYINHSLYGNIALTPEGRKKAKRIYSSHLLLTDFIVKTLGLDRNAAETDACQIEHVISEKMIDAIEEYLERNK